MQNMTLRIINGSDKSWSGRLERPSILMIDSDQDLESFFKTLKFYNHPSERYHHLIYSSGAGMSVIKPLLEKRALDTVNILLETSPNVVSLVSIFTFSATKCRSNQFVDINHFTRSTMQWNNTQFYPEKFRNFHGCYLFVRYSKEQVLDVIDIVQTFVKLVNATEVADLLTDNSFIDLNALLAPQLDDSLTSFTFYVDTEVFIIPQGTLYTPLEKMFKPFSFEVWVAILITLTIGFVSIWLISRCPLFVKNFVFSRFINTPSLNLISIFFNGGQHKVPTRNFSRFLLTLFIVWCLIIRTCYQSELFKHLQDDERKPPIATFAEIFEKNFTVLAPFYENNEQATGLDYNTNETHTIRLYAAEIGAPM
jgi:hypothetical protein